MHINICSIKSLILPIICIYIEKNEQEVIYKPYKFEFEGVNSIKNKISLSSHFSVVIIYIRHLPQHLQFYVGIIIKCNRSRQAICMFVPR